MLKRLSTWIVEFSKGWVALSALLGFLLFSIFVLPAQSARSEKETGGAGSPDTSLYYTPEKLYQLAGEYGPKGRKAYIRTRFTFDLIFPLVYAIFLTTAISWVYKKVFPSESFWMRINLTPLLGAGFDYLENISTSLVMFRYPSQTAGAAFLAPILTLVKWAFIGSSFLILGIGTAAALWGWIKKMGS
ncbi:MAG: hypothetical protein KGY46_09700 [Anaerolineales bacterium]|nr:hypothetical protein [Anaerolineales bacterium]